MSSAARIIDVSATTVTATTVSASTVKVSIQSLTADGADDDVDVTSRVTLVSNTTGAATGALADGVTGQLKTISHVDATGTSYVLTPDNFGAYTDITFTALGHSVELVFDGTDWQVLHVVGAALA